MLINRVELPVSDVEHAGRFYRDVLGLPTRVVGDCAEVWVGASTLLLRRQPVAPGAYHCAITIPAVQFNEAKSWLRHRVALLRRDGLDQFALGAPWNSQSLYFTGPDGAILELIARHDLPAVLRRPFSSADLLCISEIGLAVADVPATVAQLQDTLHLPVFGSAAADFTPVGDHNGLLIVVRRDRPWFPTAAVTPSTGPIVVTIDAAVGRRTLDLTPDGRIKTA